MEASAPKRRRTSSRSSVPLDLNTRDGNADPSNAQTRESSSASDRATRPKRKLPEFASPTKASLARHNPEILKRRNAARQKARDERTSAAANDMSASRPSSRDSDGSLSALLTAQLEEEPSGGQKASRNSVPALHSPARPVTRPLPPPASTEDEEILDPFRGRGLRRSGLFSAPPTAEPEPEPELPPTPSQLGIDDPVVTTPPTGIHGQSSPSNRKRLEKSRLNRAKKGSPLKQPALRPARASEGPLAEAATTKMAQRFPNKSNPIAATSEQGTLPPLTKNSINDSSLDAPAPAAENPPHHPARRIRASDYHADKKRLVHSLRSEVALLEADLAFARSENDRIRKLFLQEDLPAATPQDAPEKELVQLLRKHLLSPEDLEKPEVSTILLEAALNPSSWLPFGKPSTTSLLSQRTTEPEPEPNPTSHHPVQMTASEELPFLSAFTPLSFRSTTSLLPQSSPKDPLLQQHNISVTSQSPPGLFTAQINMVVDTTDLTITSLTIPRLDPAAKSELIPFIDKVLSQDSKTANRAVDRNITLITWAMGEWLRVACRRAKIWITLDNELRDPEKLLRKAVPSRGRASRTDDDDHDGGEESEVHASNAEMLRNMGQTYFDIPIPSADDGLAMRLEWRIDFDWTGTAQSKIGILVGFPGKWHKADSRNSLSKIPALFGDLVQNGDIISGARTIIALLAGDENVR